MPLRQLHLRDGDLVIRRMRDEPEEWERVAAWRNQPHVRAWWDPDEGPSTAEDVAEEYRAEVAGETETIPCIIEFAGMPIGFTQTYPWAAEEEEVRAMGLELPAGAWGIDTFIGEPARLGQGLGRRAIRLLSDHLLEKHGATAIALGVEVGNARALRMYLAAGMVPVREYLDLDTRGGQRVTCMLMIREADGSRRSPAH